MRRRGSASDAEDEEDLRAAIEALLAAPGRPADEPATPSTLTGFPTDPAPPVDQPPSGVTSTSTRWVDPLTGAWREPVWALFVGRAIAEWERFGRAMVVVQLEVAGHQEIAERMGREAALSLLAEMATTAVTSARRSDVFGHVPPWRLQGVLPETDRAGGERWAQRIKDRFRIRLGSSLPIPLRIGVASAAESRSIPSALRGAEQAMYAQTPGSDPTVAEPRPGSVGRALAELDELRAAGSLSDAAYEHARSAILERL